MEDAIDWLRKKGLSAVEKKSSRIAAEGLIGININGKKGAMIEINSETDFVARNELFQEFVNSCSKLITTNKVDIETLKNLSYPDSVRSVEQELNNNIATIGSGSMYAQAAATALKENNPKLTSEEIVKKSLKIAADICVYTNHNIIIEKIK